MKSIGDSFESTSCHFKNLLRYVSGLNTSNRLRWSEDVCLDIINVLILICKKVTVDIIAFIRHLSCRKPSWLYSPPPASHECAPDFASIFLLLARSLSASWSFFLFENSILPTNFLFLFPNIIILLSNSSLSALSFLRAFL